MDICFEGVGQVAATFQVDGRNVETGMAVSLTGSGTVGLKDGGELCGVTVSAVRGGAAAVQIGGVVKVGCSGEDAPDVGYAALVCDGKGGVKTAGAGGTKFLVLAVGEDGKSVTVRL